MKKQILQRIFTTLLICPLGLCALPVFAEDTAITTISDSEETADTDAVAEADADTESSSEIIMVEDTASGQRIITSVTDISYTMGYAIPVGTDWEEFFAAYFSDELWLSSVPCETTEGDIIYANVTWSDPQPDTSATGALSLTGTVVLPDDTALADGAYVSKVHCYVSIQAEGTPTLDCWYIADGAIHLPWVSSGVEDMNAVVLYQQEESDCWYESDYFFCDSDAVHLSLDGLTCGSFYIIKVVWDGGSTNIFFFTYTGTVSTVNYIGGDRDGGDTSGNSLSGVRQLPPDSTEEEDSSANSDSSEDSSSSNTSDLTADSSSSNTSDSAADSSSSSISDSAADSNSSSTSDSAADSSSTDESDSSGSANSANHLNIRKSSISANQSDNQDFSDSKTISDSPTSSDSSASDSASDSRNKSDSSESDSSDDEVFMETVTDTYSLISGTRLNLMRQTGSVRFSKQGITVTLSDSALDSLNITNDSQFYIEIQATDNGFSLIVEMNGQSVTNLPDTTVMLPYSAADTDYAFTLKDTTGQTVTGSYNAASGIMTFTIQHTGTYTFISVLSASGAESDADSSLTTNDNSDTGLTLNADSDIPTESGVNEESGTSYNRDDTSISEPDTELSVECMVTSRDDSNHHSGRLSVYDFGIVIVALLLIAGTFFFLIRSKTASRRLLCGRNHSGRHMNYYQLRRHKE